MGVPNNHNNNIWVPTVYFKIIMWCQNGHPQIMYLLFHIAYDITVNTDIGNINQYTQLTFSTNGNTICTNNIGAAVNVRNYQNQIQVAITEQSAGGTCTASSPLLMKIKTALKVLVFGL